MCGIAGFTDNKINCRNMQNISNHMARTLIPRGPDDGGEYTNEYMSLIHRRLIVVDPENGKQPMKSPDERYVLVYNGELYNTEDIRKELLSKGHTFLGHSDTEVLLHAYMEWNTNAFEKLNGIYAFAIWDNKEHTLTLCRDRLGVKPLFFTKTKNGLVFGSEIKTLLCHPDIKPEINQDGLRSILLLGPARPAGFGVFNQIKELLPAHFAIFKDNKLTITPYWSLKACEHTDSPEQTIAKTKYLIEDSASRQLVSDVPLCTFLSGGLDSSILSMLASREYKKQNKQLHTWSVDYKDNDKYFEKSLFQPNSDADYIDLISNAIGSKHHKVILDNAALCAALLPAVDARDLAGMADVDSSLLLFCNAVKKEFTVCQSGECADELFGGYPWYHREEILFEDTFPWSRSIDFRMSLLNDGVISNGEEFVRQHYLDTCKLADKLPTDSKKEARMREMFMLNLRWFMATLLDRKDRMSMYSGLEVRVPFCDHRIVEYAYNMPWELKAYEGREKGIVRKAFENDLPEKIVWRKKSPYPKTFSPLYTELVSSYVRQIIQDEHSYIPKIFNTQAIEQLLLEPNNMSEPWYGQLMRGPQVFAYIIQLDRWFKKYHVSII